MFDNAYSFTKTFSKVVKNGSYLRNRTTYVFKTPKDKYLIEVEHYSNDIYIIKFCLAKHKRSPKRFNVLTGENKMGPIIATCMQLILQILKKNSKANFGFIGSHTFDPSRHYEESKVCTKRFKIYRYAVYNFIGEEYFSHFMEERNSTYLLINNKNENVEGIRDHAHIMFEAIFPSLREV